MRIPRPPEPVSRPRRRDGVRDRPFRRFILLAILVVSGAGCALPRWPVDGPLVSPFGVRTRGLSLDLHRGVDIRVPNGTPVQTVARGRVRYAGSMAGYGQVIWIDHPGSLMTVYAHLSAIRVRAGEEVRRGQAIGLSGSSGDATGPHLHFEVWRHGREVDPVPLFGRFPG